MTEDPNAAQRAFWNGEATRRWQTEQARIDAIFASLTEAALALAAPRPGEHVLDVGCGTGTTLLALARAVGPGGSALGVDISEQMLALARQRIAAAALPQARVELADAGSHPFPPGGLDLLFSRFGVMFFADPVAAFGNLRRALKPGGRVAMAAFRPQAENPWVTVPLDAVRHLLPEPPPPGPEEPGQFAFGNPDRVRRILAGAGFTEVALQAHDPDMFLGANAEEAAAGAVSLSRVGLLVQGQPEPMRAAALAALTTALRPLEGPGGVVLKGGIWLISARAP